MTFQLVSFHVHFRFENNKLFLQTLFVQAKEMIFLEVILERIVVNIILLLTTPRPSITNVTSFVAVATVSVQFIVAIKPLTAETTFRVTLKATLFNGSRNMISVLLVLAQLRHSEEFVFMGEDFLVSRTQIARR